MNETVMGISQANAREIEGYLQAVLRRYSELFPDWEVSTVSVQKSRNRNEQLDGMIALLENLKTEE